MLKRSGMLLSVAILLAAGPLLAQRGGMMGMMPPSMNGVWNPVVGSGATYEMVGKDGKKQTISIAIVSKEDSGGQTGYWLEMMTGDNPAQANVIQMLMVKDASQQMSAAKMIIQQAGGRGPMEISGSMMGMMSARGGAAPPTPKSDFREGAENVGTESVNTPAGSFDTMHWRNKDGANVWISTKAGPWGFVKSVSADGATMTLVKVITDAKSHIVGTPQSMDSMMGGARGRGQD